MKTDKKSEPYEKGRAAGLAAAKLRDDLTVENASFGPVSDVYKEGFAAGIAEVRSVQPGAAAG